MPLSKAALRQRMDSAYDPPEERLVVEPFIESEPPDKVAPASLDFHLGCRFTFLRRGRAVFHDPLSKEEFRDVAATEVFIPLGGELYLHPGQLVLGTTLEWFRFPHNLMAYVVGRSIWGRRGLLVVTASAVQPYTSGTITLELSNVGEITVILKPGVALGQLFFHELQAPEVSSVGKRPPFAITGRPIFGQYAPTRLEEVLMGIAPRIPVGQQKAGFSDIHTVAVHTPGPHDA